MSARKDFKNNPSQWLIEKIKDGADYRKGCRIVYAGSKAGKPKGWRIIERV